MMPRILLHTCCGPCTLFPARTLKDSGWLVHGFFYNPNIQPYQEFTRRLDALRTVADHLALQLIVREDYELEEFLRQAVFRESQRCIFCYRRRIEETARLAAKSRFDAFTTTLLYSRMQQHDLIRSLAEEASNHWCIPFHYEDFRVGWAEGQNEARSLGVYRQAYCGCIYSERDRFQKVKTARNRAAQNQSRPAPRST
jgi:hypothetical protein